MIKIKNLSKTFSSGFIKKEYVKAVDNATFEIEDGKIVSLIGESGSGKTTIGKLILKLVKPTEGEILYKDRNIYDYNPIEYYRNVQGVFQDPFASFNPIYKIDNIFDMLFNSLYNEIPKSERLGRIEKSLKDVGLNPKHIIGKYPHQLSGGQLQRLLIARALILESKFLVADEIISMLDASTRVDVLNILGDLKYKNKMSILFITHDLSLGYYISDWMLIMYRGTIVEMGDTKEIFSNPLHPYTQMLFDSVPTLDKKWDDSETSTETGEEPPKTGCKFAHRCPFATDKCKTYNMESYTVNKNHQVSCIKFANKNN
ncbi:peptide ABC transporter ATPase [Marinitoga sp. 1135]|uniref:Oligopeptide/dipeptide ABC transporter, ATP-binding protein n=1 Tax=Marinitoga piezophila (strain DSM 14283 / JCM 11233 / KA3) TaxID=443254 RepID=H2J7V0_MARPK|nr:MULTISPECIES: ABC transporter ATP-binding protein [Marinitoga]AEX85441.1 oligopeptide/dipeptide ABC transporter, ATP-binding protein [Marinitoga piezophila KA3]APT75916.1 peptide ABC transporter ATPase [Marinitoga sp. 1137]NUU95662.1 peptide ABC transporter ATPase [Marinitoga sp. 1135]NUU97583.1 peptide ABC transporter ATPase [Marinitoga sp. 1138]